MYRYRALLSALILFPLVVLAGPPQTPPGLSRPALHPEPKRLELPALDLKSVLAQDKAARKHGKPPRYAVTRQVNAVTPETAGTWETLSDGRRVWRYAVHAKNATSVQPAFTDFHLPPGAALYVYSEDGARVRGPYTAKDNHDYRQLWVPVVEGDTAVIELVLDPGVAEKDVSLSMDRVLQGYWRFWENHGWDDALAKAGMAKSASCEVDVACSVANAWQNQVDSAARIAIGGALCSGQLVNDTAYDGRPLFLTAHHCGLSESNAASVTVYWNFQSPTCRTGAASGSDTRVGSLDDVTMGSRLLADYAPSDFTLVELAEPPKSSYDVYWTGWDRRDMTYPGGVSIHHPAGDEKRISIENDQLSIKDGADIASGVPTITLANARPRSHIQANDWDIGVTEKGSSGGGLWEPTNHRLIGQLTGGQVKECENSPRYDFFGRIWMSWDGGGTTDSRLRDYLDPLDSGAKTLDGTRGCSVSASGISISPANPKIGDTVTLAATGTGLDGLEYAWDIDGDGTADARGRSLQVSYPGAFSGDVHLSAHKPGTACGQRFSKSLDVTGPDLELANVGEPFQVAGAGNGDGDDVMEPGERWAVRVTLRNTGDSRATGVQAVFVPPGSGHMGGPDAKGYTYADSRGQGCVYRFQSIAGGGNGVSFNPSSSDFSGNDDGGTDPIALSNFKYYGQSLNSVVMSSNGYLATSATRKGGDYTNDCPLPPSMLDIDGGGSNKGRMAALHDDLITGNGWSKRFADCPRPPDAAGATGACRVFQWSNVTQYDGTSRFDFQALLYEGSNEIVYQYGPDLAVDELTATVGIHDQALSTGLTYACDDGSNHIALRTPAPNTAVCFFDPDHKAIAGEAVHIETPVLPYDDIPAGGNQTSTLEFSIDQDAPCGSQFEVGLDGAVFDGGFSAGPGSIFIGRVGGADGVCDSVVKSGAAKAAEIDFRPGNYYNPDREGHGVDIHRSGPNAFLLWFTYEKDRTPVWYLAAGPYRDNQLQGDLLRYTMDPDAALTPNRSCTQAGANPSCEAVGEATFTFTGTEQGVFNWTLNGESGGEPFQFLPVGPSATPVNHTGHWYPPSQVGWGSTFNDQGNTEIGIVYFYDENGNPVWALGSTNDAGTSSQVQIPMLQFTGVCPNCVWAAQQAKSAGTLTRSFSGDSDGKVSTSLQLVYPRSGDWNRNNLAIKILSDPQN